jgi:hypothetical protein
VRPPQAFSLGPLSLLHYVRHASPYRFRAKGDGGSEEKRRPESQAIRRFAADLAYMKKSAQGFWFPKKRALCAACPYTSHEKPEVRRLRERGRRRFGSEAPLGGRSVIIQKGGIGDGYSITLTSHSGADFPLFYPSRKHALEGGLVFIVDKSRS